MHFVAIGRGRRDRSICTHCGATRHQINKCYKLHGYLPGYQPCFRASYSRSTLIGLSHFANVVVSPFSRAGAPPTPQGVRDNYTHEQLQSMISYLSTQLQKSTAISTDQKPLAVSADHDVSSTDHLVSQIYGNVSSSPSNKSIMPKRSSWILDTRATHHVCCQ